jgi:spore germination protein GerM
VTARTAAAATVLVVATFTGCGVTPDDGPRAIDPPRSPFQTIASPSQIARSGAISQTLYLVKDDKLVAVTRHVDAPTSLRDIVAALIAGPTNSEADQGITSALRGSAIVASVRATGGQATVELAPSVDGAPRTDEILAYGQLVCTLTTLPEVTGVTFTREGKPVGVPRGDGSLSPGPLTTADYAVLIG